MRGVNHDRFDELLGDVGADGLTDLAQRYSYVLPDDRALAALAGLGPLVEVGAGTGYWASRLRARGVDVVAIDQAPPDGERTNRYHARTVTWTEVIAGDQTMLRRYSDRALFLCWPPLFSSLGGCLTDYGGSVVALVGDGGIELPGCVASTRRSNRWRSFPCAHSSRCPVSPQHSASGAALCAEASAEPAIAQSPCRRRRPRIPP